MVKKTKLRKGLVAMPKEEKVPLRWPYERDMIPRRIKELMAQGVVWRD